MDFMSGTQKRVGKLEASNLRVCTKIALWASDSVVCGSDPLYFRDVPVFARAGMHGRLFGRLSVDVFDACEAFFFDIKPGLQSPGDGVIDCASEAELQEYFPLPLEYGLTERYFFLQRLRGGLRIGPGFQRLCDRQVGSILVREPALHSCARPEPLSELVKGGDGYGRDCQFGQAEFFLLGLNGKFRPADYCGQ